jgi:hypothetical protein
MRALTLTQPWAGLVASGVKRVENRDRPIIKRQDFGKVFAIHASREIDDAVYDRIAEIAPELNKYAGWDLTDRYRLSRITSAVIAVAIIEDVEDIRDHEQARRRLDLPWRPVALQVIHPDQHRWFFGPVGYMLRDIRALATPVPCRGWQGFWHLTPAVERAVTEQLHPDHTTRTP